MQILSQEEYKEKFFCGDEPIKREFYNDIITKKLSKEFDIKYNEKTKRWVSNWNNCQRFVVELASPKGTYRFLEWGYNYDFIPDINKKEKLLWNRTDSAVRIHISDAWYDHVERKRDKEWGYSAREFCNPQQCPDFIYKIPEYTSDMEFALNYIEDVISINIPLMHQWLENVKSIDDAINVLNQKVLGEDIFRIPYMHYVRSFLYAKNKHLSDAIEVMNQCYDGRKIPQILIEKLEQLANE